MADVTALLTATIAEVSGLIERREISPLELVAAQLARIEALDGSIGSYLHVTAGLAREQARRAERELAAGQYRGRLHGIPVGIEDLVLTRGYHNADAAALLGKLDAAGAVCVGRLKPGAYAGHDDRPDTVPPRNPWHLDHAADVWSSGAGAATAASLCFGALAGDAGGDLRFPAAACGVVGLKASFGKVSRFGMFTLADTLDRIGPLARSVADATLLLAAIEGRDARDPATRDDRRIDYLAAIAEGARGLRIGIDRGYCAAGDDPAQADALFRACFILKGQGLDIFDVDLAGITEACADWLAICAVDALRGRRASFPSQASGYDPALRALLEHGLGVTPEDEARGLRARQQVFALIDSVLGEVDCILCPASPRPAQRRDDSPPPWPGSPAALAAMVRYSAPTGCGGHPAITVPYGFTADGLPTAMQFIGRRGDEATILRVAAAYERATGWHRRRPSLAA